MNVNLCKADLSVNHRKLDAQFFKIEIENIEMCGMDAVKVEFKKEL